MKCISTHKEIEIVTMTMCTHILCLLFIFVLIPWIPVARRNVLWTYKKKKQKGCNNMSRYFKERKQWLLSMETSIGRLAYACSGPKTRDLGLSDMSVVYKDYLVSKSTDSFHGLCLAPLHPQQQLWVALWPPWFHPPFPNHCQIFPLQL